MTVRKDDWEKQFKKWKDYRIEKLGELDRSEKNVESFEKPSKLSKKDFEKGKNKSYLKSSIERVEEKIVREVKEAERKIINFVEEPKHIRVIKIIALLIPIAIIGYLIYSNFIESQEFDYFYDIGSIGENYLTPVNRISGLVEGNPNYRNLTSGLVYFNVPIARGSEKVNVKVRFKNNFPENEGISLGAKDQEVWHYNYHLIYSPTLEKISKFQKRDNVYLINSNLSILSPEELRYEGDIIVATDKLYAPLPNIISDYIKKETVINTSLRGKHIFYIYAFGDLEVKVKKQDINWYKGSDELEILLYDLENNLIANTTISDDGEAGVNKKAISMQEGMLNAESLKEGVYKLEFRDFDGLIREIRINTNKIVVESAFLADNSIYNVKTKPSELYFESSRKGQIRLITYHSEGIQNVRYKKNDVNKIFNFYREDKPLYVNVNVGEYKMSFPKNDIIVSGVGYFAFSKENYFEPFKQRVVPIRNDFDWIVNNVDYLITDYKPLIKDEDWFIAETEFNIKEDNLFVKDNKLSLVFNIPHLSQEDLQNYTIPIDWIKITVHKPGAFEK